MSVCISIAFVFNSTTDEPVSSNKENVGEDDCIDPIDLTFSVICIIAEKNFEIPRIVGLPNHPLVAEWFISIPIVCLHDLPSTFIMGTPLLSSESISAPNFGLLDST